MESEGFEFKACPCGAEPQVIDMKGGKGLNQVGVRCPVCGLSNLAVWGGETGTGREDALAMVADSWNSR